MEMATEAARLVHWFASPRPVAANRSSGASLLGGDIDWLDGALGALPPTTTQKRCVMTSLLLVSAAAV